MRNKNFLYSAQIAERGFVGVYLTVLILVLMIGIIVSIAFGVVLQQRISQNIVQSAQSYVAAESGVEDALLRLRRGWNTPSSYVLSVASSSASVAVSPVVFGARTVSVEGDSSSRFRDVEVVYELSGTAPGFFYGAQVGVGGLRMQNASRVVGNVFSNGSATLQNNSEITDTISIAGTGTITGGEVGGDVFADSCSNTNVTGTLHANSESGCSYASLTSDGLPVDAIELPIPDSQITDWKNDALAGGSIGTFTRNSGIHSLGPVQINGDLILQNSAQLVVTGTIWVTGTVDIKNSAQVRLDTSYGTTSGVIIGDDTMELQNSSVSSGSGQSGSYLMYISTSSADPAITIKNFAQVDIVYSNTGWVSIANNTRMRSIDAYGIEVQNDAELTYEIGLSNAFFTSGPSAGWAVSSWKEVE